MLHLPASLQSSPGSLQAHICTSSPTCLCASCAAPLSITTEHSGSNLSVQHHEQPIWPHIPTPHTENLENGIVCLPPSSIEGSATNLYRGHGYSLNSELLSSTDCHVLAASPYNEGVTDNPYKKGTQCFQSPVSTSSRASHSFSIQPGCMSDNACIFPSTQSQSFAHSQQSSVGDHRLSSVSDNSSAPSCSTNPLPENMLSSSRKDNSARVRNEDDVEEELVNFGYGNNITPEQTFPGRDVGASKMMAGDIHQVPPSKRRQRHQTMRSDSPSLNQHVPMSFNVSLQGEFGEHDKPSDLKQNIQRARPTRVATASGYYPSVASSSFPPSPPGTRRSSRPLSRTSFFFSPCDLSSGSSSDSEEELTDSCLPKAKSSYHRTIGRTSPTADSSTSRLRRSRCRSAATTGPLSEASMSSLHAAFSSSLSMSSDSFSTLAGSLTSTSSSLPNQSQGSFDSAIMPFSTMVDLATAKAENITGLYFAKQMNATLRRSLPSLRTSVSGDISSSSSSWRQGKPPMVDVNSAGIMEQSQTRESPPGSPLTPVPGSSPKEDHCSGFESSSNLTFSFAALSPTCATADHEQPATHSHPSSFCSKSSQSVAGDHTRNDNGGTCQQANAPLKGRRMFDQGYPVEMNAFPHPDTRACMPASNKSSSSPPLQRQQRHDSSLPPLPSTKVSPQTHSWAEAHLSEKSKKVDPRDNLRRSRTTTCSGFTGGMVGAAADQQGWASHLSNSLPTSSSMSSLCENAKSKESNDSTPKRGQHRRYHSASHFFHLSSLRHHSPAQFNLALCYEHGQGGVNQDLGKAIHFYQQAAMHGHSKASYNLGCICFHHGQIHRAIGWFELASKCRVRNVETIRRVEQALKRVEDHQQKDPSAKKMTASNEACQERLLVCPSWKSEYLASLSSHVPSGTGSAGSTEASSPLNAASLRTPQGLWEQQHGASIIEQATVATSGPTAPYLPALLTLALLCRQGVNVPTMAAEDTTRRKGGQEGDEHQVFLPRVDQQAIRVLQRLIAISPPTLANDIDQTPCLSQRCHTASETKPKKRGDTTGKEPRSSTIRSHGHHHPTSGLDAAAASPSPHSSVWSPNRPARVHIVNKESAPLNGKTSNTGEYGKDRSTPILPAQQSNRGSSLSPQHRHRRHESYSTTPADFHHHHQPLVSTSATGNKTRGAPRACLPAVPLSTDDHESWAVLLARHLLQYWQRLDAEALTAISATAAVSHERIERYHLLHMTNPTNGKILYNLGLVYDIYLGQPLIASRCYLSAYEKSLIVIPEEQMDQGSGTTTNSAESLSSKGKAVTRINSAWNLGVLYAKDSQWALARDWFLRAQQELTSVSHSSWSDEQTTEIRTNTSSVNNQKEHSLLLAQHQEDSHHTSPVCTDDTRLKAVLALVDRHLIQANVIP